MNAQVQQGLSAKTLFEVVEAGRFGVEYQPIISLDSGENFGFEALSRFYDAKGESVRPDLVYAALHESPMTLFQVEFAQKQLQLEHADRNVLLFVNLDQDAFYACQRDTLNNPFIDAIRQYGHDRVVVELIENSEINDALQSLSMIAAFAAMDVPTALDDLCNPQSLMSVPVMQLVEWIKLDKYVLKVRHDERMMLFVRKLIEFAHQTGKKVILEGVETREDLAFARILDVDFVQGFLFRERFVQVMP
ncbi:EAL domain-containing protein [Marinobacterium mangrovicola]|uniref:EAL domain-containing protein (Putative c-di-GMP-specific phosphodiesterase class I) n=1 Tax=Marinobacterium mangrovicola TaxID=1476959 RepID=A0A4R1G4N1_9GAMM|nr:EAL domain-containing protein [Marinobacterium mangrovicola]TCK02644.1 EAL domain-containing protein (putative c-di-GMP-specific phosphodiesterase class I) [Marinobacterium mangrovicola]